jgi:hypothetical protein
MLSAAEYKKICNETITVKNDQMALTVKECDGRSIKFLLQRAKTGGALTTPPPRIFDFDFRWYEPYHGGS